MTDLNTLILALSLAALAFSCSSAERSQRGTATVPLGTPAPMSDGALEERVEACFVAPESEPRSTESIRKVEKELMINAWRQVFRKSKLDDLKLVKLSPDDIEIRVWQIPGLYRGKTDCWIFSRKAGFWKGSAIVDREFSGRPVKVSLDDLPPGSTGWQDYVDQNLWPESLRKAALTITDVNYEGWMIVVEVKFGDAYELQGIEDDKFLEGLFNAVKAEFLRNDNRKWITF